VISEYAGIGEPVNMIVAALRRSGPHSTERRMKDGRSKQRKYQQ